MDLYDLSIPYFDKSLQQLDLWIDKTLEFATSKSFDANTLLTARLAPDQLPLVRQIQIACDNAKFAAARLTGQPPPAHPDTETTWEELRARIKTVREYLKTFDRKAFEGAETRRATLSWLPVKYLEGKDYLTQFAIPNFGFHHVTAYAILRHNGVSLGKGDFIGSLPLHDA